MFAAIATLLLVGLFGLVYYLSIPRHVEKEVDAEKGAGVEDGANSRLTDTDEILSEVLRNIEPPSFVPSEARIVVGKASYGNKFNDVIGNFNSGLAPGAKGMVEVVIPSDWYMFRTPPTEFDGPYWPRGSIEPDFIYPGGGRPLRSQNLYASQIVS